MIVFDLKCGGQGHVFEGWFGSSAAFEEQRRSGLLTCPLCGSAEVGKAPMAPAVPAKGASSGCASRGSPDPLAGAPAEVKAMLAAAAVAQRKLLASSESVGDRFAEEARAIHLGDAEARPIHGRATLPQAARLVEEGVPIAPLPFPVVAPEDEN
jgi:hypothetical protein